MTLREAAWTLLGYGVLPAWLAAGGADWLCHRRTRIEQTSGPRESLLHFALFLQIAVPVLLGLWLEITAALLLIMGAGVVAHMLTSWWDTSIAQPLRHIAPIEQQVHSWLEMLPLFALLLVGLLHLDQLAAPDWTLTSRAVPAPRSWRWGVPLAFAAALALIGEELLRGLRASRSRALGRG
jgi:hypothetical protein